MEKIVQEVDKLMTSIQQDTTRSELPDLALKLVELSKIYGTARQEVIRTKSKYDREFVMKKEQRKQKLEDEESKKEKKSKVSNVEIEHYTELELLPIKREQEEPSVIVAFLDVYLKSIYERINSLKFVDRNTTIEKFSDKPF